MKSLSSGQKWHLALIARRGTSSQRTAAAQCLTAIKSRVRAIKQKTIRRLVRGAACYRVCVTVAVPNPLCRVSRRIVDPEKAHAEFERIHRSESRGIDVCSLGDVVGIEQSPGKRDPERRPLGRFGGLLPLKQGRQVLPSEAAVGARFLPADPRDWI